MKSESQITPKFDLGNRIDVVLFFMKQGTRRRKCRMFELRKWVSFCITVILGVCGK